MRSANQSRTSAIGTICGSGTFFGQGVGAENTKFRFAPKLPSICIKQKRSMGV